MNPRRLFERFGLDAIVLILLTVGELEIWFSEDIQGSRPLLAAYSLLWGIPMLARRRFPLGAPLFVLLALALEVTIWTHVVTYSFATFMIAMVTVGWLGHLGEGRPRLYLGAFALAVIVYATLRDTGTAWTDLLTVIPFAGFSWLVGHVYHGHQRRTDELIERAERLERGRETEARAAVAEERTRIAREMHDVVAHSLSVIVVQAEAAEAMLDADPERARRPLTSVQDTARDALTELRRMLGALRENAGEEADLAPQAGLGELDALAAHVRDAGLPVRVRVEGRPRALPSALDLSAFRIVQEGLTNALKHAGPARAEVLVRYGERDLELEVSDDGRGHDPRSTSDGHGLLGMRERVALFGGELTAGPRPGSGGFSLCARLPIEHEPTR